MAARRRRAARKKSRGGGRKRREVLCVGSKVKAYIKSKKLKCAGDLVEALSERVHDILDGAMTRTSGNKRSTVRPVDL
ncbi:MAG: hypothetical protein ACE5JG_00475 [Planctomycetota bacterium]